MFGALAYDPMTGLAIDQPEPDPAAVPAPVVPQGTFSKMANRLAGTQFGEPRVQLWPEKMLRSALTLPGDVVSGEQAMLAPGLRREDYTDAAPPSGWTVAAQPNDPGYERAQDLAGMAGGGMVFGRMAQPAAEAAVAAAPKPAVAPRPVAPPIAPEPIAAAAPKPAEAALEWHPHTLLEDSASVGAPVAALEHAPPFSSSIEPAFAATNRGTATGAQWASELKRYGAKPEEMDWRGVTDLLNSKENQPIPRAEIESHIGGNKIELKPVDLKSGPEWKDLSPDQQYAIKDAWADDGGRHRYDEPHEFYEKIRAENRLGTRFPDLFPGGESKYAEYQLPGGENYRERLLTLPPPSHRRLGDLMKIPEESRTPAQRVEIHRLIEDDQPDTYRSSHWDEPNVLVHRRSNERVMDAMPAEDIAAKVEAAYPDVNRNHWGSGIVDKAVRDGVLNPQEAADFARHFNFRTSSGKFPGYETMPGTGTRTLHAEEIQSDWHQTGRKEGYIDPNNKDPGRSFGQVPDGPFKDSWHRLALHDMVREAAEKGFDRISWTAGDSQSTHPKNIGGSQRAIEESEKGMRAFYDDKLVNAANKIGKAHGVSVQKGTIADTGAMSGEKAMNRMGIPAHEQDAFWNSIKNDHQARNDFLEAARDRGHDIHHMDIPASLKEQALKKGFSLFEDSATAGAPLAALEHSPYIAGHAPEAAPAEAAAATPARGNGPGRAGGGDASLSEAATAAARRAGTRAPLEGLPIKALKIGDEHFVPGPIGKVHDVAEQYMAGRELPSYHKAPTKYHPLDEEHSRSIARAFDEMKHAPDDPAVKASYDALIKETGDQYQAIKKSGLKIEPITADMPDPYAANPRLAAKDVAENNHLWYFPTDAGFGSNPGAGIDMATHPMMRKTGEKIGDRELLANDQFRIVHDYFGHLKEGYGFRAAGEDNAWRSHASMYSDLARPAMTTETRGQNSWVNYGPHGESNRTASAADTKYADQKVGLMPEWTMRDRGSPEPTIAYQGSPHTFDKFEIGRAVGEGNQHEGAGLYFSDREPIGDWYRHQLAARRDPLLKKYGLDSEDGANIGTHLASHGGDVAAAKRDLANYRERLMKEDDGSRASKNAIERVDAKIGFLGDPARNPGHLYQVAIDHPKEALLDWDLPLRDQPVLGKVRKTIAPEIMAEFDKKVAAGASGSIAMPADKGAAAMLRDAGIPGAQYAYRSSNRGVASRNYVMFDAPRILKRYAAPGLIGAGGFGSLAPGREE